MFRNALGQNLEVAHQAPSNNSNAAAAKNVFVPAFALDDTYNGFSAMTHTTAQDGGMGLKAASFVSMEHTAQEHEYQPTCPCTDCQGLLREFTAYDVLDAYVSQHLPYEASVMAQFGFIPCVGGPHGNVAMRREYDAMTGQCVGQVPETSTALVFHFHRHHMNDVQADIRVKSLNRFYDHQNHRNNHNNNNGSAPTTPARAPNNMMSNNHNTNHRRYSNNNGNTNSRQQQQQFATKASNAHFVAAAAEHSNNHAAAQHAAPVFAMSPQQQQFLQQQQNAFATHSATANHRNDSKHAAMSVAFTEVARLGW